MMDGWQIRRASIAFVGAPADANLLLHDILQVKVIEINSQATLPIPPPPPRTAAIDFTIQHPTCGEVTIYGRVLEDTILPEGMVMSLKTRVPTIALANKSAAVDYVQKVIESVVIKQSPPPAPAEEWKMSISHA